MKILIYVLFLIILLINLINCLKIDLEKSNKENEMLNSNINFLEISKEKLIDQLFSNDKKVNEEVKRDDIKISDSSYQNKDNKIQELFEAEIASFIYLFSIERRNFKSLSKKIVERKNTYFKRVNGPSISNNNLEHRKNLEIDNKINNLLDINSQNNLNKTLKDLGKIILNKLVCKKKKKLLMELLNKKLAELKLNNSTFTFSDLFGKEKLNSSKILEMIINNETIHETQKRNLKKEIGFLMQRSKDPQALFNYSKENLHELRSIINETLFCPNYCSGNGYCLESKCFCKPGFKGSDCSQRQLILECPNNCSNENGKCNEAGYCMCKEGFSGIDCSLNSKKNKLIFLNFS